MRAIWLLFILVGGPALAVEEVAHSLLPAGDTGVTDFSHMPLGSIASGTRIGGITIATGLDSTGKARTDQTGLVLAEVTDLVAPFPGSERRDLQLMGLAWLTNSAPGGLDPLYNAGRGTIALLFEPPICAVGLEFAQFGSVMSLGRMGYDMDWSKSTRIQFQFIGQDGKVMDTETRLPSILWNALAFETSKGETPIIAVTLTSQAKGGLGLTKVTAIPCSQMVS